MVRFYVLVLILGVISVGALPRAAKVAEGADLTAYAVIRDGSGNEIGYATFRESGVHDMTVEVRVFGLTPGRHGLHIHAVGRCDGPDFISAGGHFNPVNRKHGLQTSDGAHAGDLPNLDVRSNGTGSFSMTVARFTLSPGGLSVLDSDGSAIVIHAAEDDGMTDATGNSGARVACGVITAG